MTNATPAQPAPQPQDELAQIRAILTDVAQRQQVNQIQIDRNTTALAETRAAIAETRALTESNAAALAETRAIADSNARAIEANAATIATNFAATRQEIRDTADDLFNMIRTVSESVGSASDSVQNLSNSVQNLIEDSRTDRQNNEREHAAFREQFQSLLLSFTQEIRQIWQRLSA